MSLRAAIYARVSTDIQRDNYSVPSQIKDMIGYANSHGYSLIGNQYVDPDTGRDITKSSQAIPAYVDDFTSRELSRPSLDNVLLFLETVGFDILVVHAVDRLARDPYIRQTIEREFTERGARVEYVLGNYDESPEGEVRKDLDATFAKWENAKRLERCNRGRRRKAESGKFVAGTAPYGYRMDVDAFGGLLIHEPEAETVRMIFSMYAEQRLSMHQIVRELNQRHIETYDGKTIWQKSSVYKILDNTTYVGFFHYNKFKRQGKNIALRDESEWIRIECEPIVDPSLFSIVQELKEQNKAYTRKTPKRFYLLSGMVVCDYCKKAYITQTAKAGKNNRINDMPVYRHRISQGHCCNKYISGGRLEPLVWEGVVNILLNPRSLREGYEQSISQEMQKQTRQIRHLETLQRAIEKLKGRRAKLQEMYLDADIGMTKVEYLEQRETIDAQIKVANIDIEKITIELQKTPTLEDLERLEHFSAKIVSALGNNLDISPQNKRQIMQFLNLKVFISRDEKIKLTGWFMPETEDLLSTSSAHYVRQRRRLRVRV